MLKSKPLDSDFMTMQYLIFLLSLLCLCGCMCPRTYIPNGEPSELPPFYVPEKVRVALVLGSGGVRGMAHVGVLEEFERAGIHFDLIVGCSAGSIVGALYADNPNAEYIKEAVYKIRTNSILDLDFWHCRYGISQGRSMRKILNQYLEAECFENLQIPLVVVATDLNSGELVPMGSGELVKCVQASASIPFIFVPIEHHGRILVDGGVVNPVPVRVARDLGAEIVIAVDLCELLPTNFPTNLFQIANRSTEIIFLWQNERCVRGADVIIRPKMCDIGTFNDKKKWEIYEAGKVAAREAIPRIRELISECGGPWEDETEKRLVSLQAYSQ